MSNKEKESAVMATIKIPRVNWTTELASAIKSAGQGDTIVVHSEAMQELAKRAMERLNRKDLKVEIGEAAES